MAAPIHTYGPSCFLAADATDPAAWLSSETPPTVRPQFFYTSPLPIDDPLTALPAPTGGQGSANAKAPLRPFSVRDDATLEEAWRSLQKSRREGLIARAKAQEGRSSKRNSGIIVPGQEPTSSADGKKRVGISVSSSLDDHQGKQSNTTPLSLDDKALKSFRGRFRTEFGSSGPEVEHEGVRKRSRTLETNSKENLRPNKLQHKAREPVSRDDTDPATAFKPSSSLRAEDTTLDSGESVSSRGNSSRDASMSGSPFIRAPIHKPQSLLGRSIESSSSRDAANPDSPTDATVHAAAKRSGLRTSVDQLSLEESEVHSQESEQIADTQWKIPVGASRLHLVELPKLKMKPIYWSPLHDISNVVRATWFYKNTMLPVETELANKLEDGYLYLKPWTETWQDELNSCVESGADAELKVVHRLWPKEDPTRPSTAAAAPPDGTPSAAHAVEQPEHSADNPLVFDENRAAGATPMQSESIKPFLNSSVIYADWREAQILRPSLLPSVSRGRRPLSAIRKGRQIGIPVVRGFSRRLWDRLHPSKPSPVEVRNYLRSTQTRAMSTSGEPVCYACAIEELRPAPTDLVLVIHGIGQKLSERMESFHFTHAINAFRRTINMELNSEPVWPHVRPGHGGIMALPVNWRSTLSLDEANLESPGAGDPASNHYSLKDITPETIPAVRSLISDVMLDIPYYLSHHKPKMIQAVVKEANRIFRLWCENNPGFQQHGRVHLLAHSLGSAMALDILSHQPTKVPRFDFSTTSVHGDIFEFDTKNLFICGSPAGFFLLLNKANLLPRRGRDKPGCEGDDRLPGVAGEADTYGCLAVDNLYNIMHTTDPIAYRVNAAVDSGLAASLKPASIPTTTSSLWSSFGSVFRWSTTGTSTADTVLRPAPITKLPTQVELETHDFTREEIAEKRMLLLNDNGQIDYYLSGGGGPLNIQYLNMLSAHSSYWTLTDFVRFVVIEIARKQGRDATLPGLRAEKKKGWRVSKG
ncbi:DDHD family phospholipase [Aspergillus saccharolyticus JOP 1030-1]|uniref:DDHD domain protein n=1 Tax=Aspergillus saccharolyticus JOP 1030-1 TaxID=1450539 RepID=A0A318ZBP5_9EURO|nr:DDHD domain protein [Aspergillus saccharolyticus JOP 1030-1]PYH43937.1 DDHD domain protein [Aspergillus saccharolyticus JOP 1030-1]